MHQPAALGITLHTHAEPDLPFDLGTKWHLLSLNLLAPGDKYRKEPFAREGQGRNSYQPAPVYSHYICPSDSSALAGLAVCSGGQQEPSCWRYLPSITSSLGPEITFLPSQRTSAVESAIILLGAELK